MLNYVKSVGKMFSGVAAKYFTIRTTLSKDRAKIILNEYSPKPCGRIFSENNTRLHYDLQVIVPAYNAGENIRTCLNSVLSQQTKFDFLITVINDGSTDNTDAILKEITAEKNNILYVSQGNCGISSARNRGLQTIYGNYIMFLDSDDVLPPDTIEKIMTVAVDTGAEIVQGSWYDFCESPVQVINENKILESGIIANTVGLFSGYPWGKIYKHTVLKNFRFPEGYWFEDTPISYILAAMPFRFAVLSDFVYGYRRNPEGITAKSVYSPKAVDSYWITEECLREFDLFGVAYDQRAYEYLLKQSIMNWQRNKKRPRKIREAIFVLTCSLMDQYFLGFETKSKSMKVLERALREKRFMQYEMYMLGNYTIDNG